MPRRPFACLPWLACLLLAAPPAGASAPTEQEQFHIELINRARLDPAGELVRAGNVIMDLNEGPPTLGGEAYTIQAGPHQPLAVNPALVDTAQAYAVELNTNDQFCHTCLGTTPEDRMLAQGYVDMASDFTAGVARYTGFYGTTTSGFVPGRENLAFRGEAPSNGVIDDLTAAVVEAHEGLFNDTTVPGRGHRSTMMYGEFREVGVGIDTGTDANSNPPPTTIDSMYLVCNFAHRSDRGPFITGVAYDDVDMDGFYTPDIGEPLGGLTVLAYLANTTTLVDVTTTYPSGGYSLDVGGIGTYDVVLTGPGVFAEVQDVMILGSGPMGIAENTKVDFVPEPAAAVQIAFALGTIAGLRTRSHRSH